MNFGGGEGGRGGVVGEWGRWVGRNRGMSDGIVLVFVRLLVVSGA